MSHQPAPDAGPGTVPVAVLAAGGSVRLGRAKQLVEWRGATLLRRAAEAASGASSGPAIVVLGARERRLRQELDGLPVEITINESWEDGLAGSIRTALGTVRKLAPTASGILLMLVDQPHVTAALLRNLVDLHRRYPGRPIACAYAGTVGAPALIPRKLFAELEELEGDSGARSILQRYRREVVELPCPAAARDIDTQSDLDDLVDSNSPGSERGNPKEK